MRSNLLLILGLCAGTLQQIVLPYPPNVCYEKDDVPVDVDVLYDDDCKDNDGNTYSQDSELYSCCDCFRYKCEEIDYWGKQKKVGWVRSVSEQCCQNCNGTVYPSNTVISTTMLEDDCLTTQTEVCRVRPGLKTAVIEQEFSYRNCCNDNSKTLQYLGAEVPEPRTCSIRICEYEESWPHSVWITEKELEGCDCCLLSNGTLVTDGATWWDYSVSPPQMKECCRGQIVTPATSQTSPGWIKVFSHDTAGGLFTSNADALSKNPDDPDALLFSRLDQLENFKTEDGFHFKIVFPELGGSNEWIQTSNPVTESTIKGFHSVKLDFDINGYDKRWKGLGLCTGRQQAFICDTPTEGRWWMCTGCQNWYPSTGTIPGPKKLGSSVKHAVTQVELYVKRT